MMQQNRTITVLICLFVFLNTTICFGLERTISKNSRPLSFFLHKKKDKKTIAAVLAFPLIGCTGAHRIYLGTMPLVPVTYTATLGGCFGILPLADLVFILTTPDLEKFINNPRVFMWVK
jgi:hypothetical protein